MKVLLGAIAWRGFEAEFVRCLSALQERYPGVVKFQPQVGDALVERARSVVATHFLEQTNADVLLTIDSDISFEPKDAIAICEQAMDYNIVAGAYACRSASTPKLSSEPAFGLEMVEFGLDPTPIPAQWTATGFMATHRRVFEALVKRPDMAKCHANMSWGFYPFYHTAFKDETVHGRILLSEDYAFCEYAREEGFDCYINPAVRLGHIGTYTYRLEDMLTRPMSPRPLRFRRDNGRYAIDYGTLEDEEPVPISEGIKMNLDAEDKFICESIRQTGAWDRETRDVMLAHLQPEWTFLDLGAHIGYFSLLAAEKCKQVIAVEPMPSAAAILEGNVEDNGLNNVRVVAAAAVLESDGDHVYMQPVEVNTGEAHRTTQGGLAVPAQTLPEILDGVWPEMVKIDIEGDEYRLLQDNPVLLEHARVVIFEAAEAQLQRNSGVGERELIELFEDAGFKTSCIFRRPTYSDWLAVKVPVLMGTADREG